MMGMLQIRNDKYGSHQLPVVLNTLNGTSVNEELSIYFYSIFTNLNSHM